MISGFQVSKAHEVYVDEFLANLMDEAFMVGAEEEAREATEAKADLTDERLYKYNSLRIF